MKPLFINTTSALLIFLWTYTALSKLTSLDIAVSFLLNSPFAAVAHQLAILLPVTELFLALLLLVPRTRLFGLTLSAMLLVAFTCYIIYMLGFYPKRPCNCGGVIAALSWTQHIFFNLFFIAITILSIKWYHHKIVDQPGHAENLHTE